MAEYLTYRSGQEVTKFSKERKPVVGLDPVDSLIFGTLIITTPFSELGDKGVELKKSFELLKDLEIRLTLPEGKKPAPEDIKG